MHASALGAMSFLMLLDEPVENETENALYSTFCSAARICFINCWMLSQRFRYLASIRRCGHFQLPEDQTKMFGLPGVFHNPWVMDVRTKEERPCQEMCLFSCTATDGERLLDPLGIQV